MSTIKYWYKIWIILFLLTLNIGLLGVKAQSPEQASISFDWSEETYSFSFSKEWDGVPVILNYSGSYNDEYEIPNYYVNETEDVWIWGSATAQHSANYSYFSNMTKTGYIDIELTLEVYRVDINIGDVGRVIWMAVKSGFLDSEDCFKGKGFAVEYFEEYHQDLKIDYYKVNATTRELMDTWSETDEVTGGYNISINNPYEELSTPILKEKVINFSTPLILVMQMYTTEKGDKIAWANVIHDFIVYKDKDNDGIYSVGDSGHHFWTPGLTISNEYYGWMVPRAENKYYRQTNEHGTDSWIDNYPRDKSVDEIASTIQFSPPTSINGTDISWGIQYPDFPIDTYIEDPDNPIEERFGPTANATYTWTSPSNFSYLFDYTIEDTQADLDFTLEMPKLTNESFYDAVQGYGLCLPQYNYLLSSFDIKEEDQKELTIPSDVFVFESNDTTVAVLDMMTKKNYTLYDYPKVSENRIIQAMGGSVNPLIMGAADLSANSGNTFVNLIYSIRDIVSNDSSFSVQSELYHLETQNYPIWSGNKFTHDPTLSIFYMDYTQDEDGGEDNGTEIIPGFNSGIIIGVIIVITTVSISQRKKKSK